MIERVSTAVLFALYQAILVIGILTLPLAIAARHVGIPLPTHRLLDRIDRAYRARAE